MNNKFLRIVICILCIYFIISCLRPNVLRQISKSKIYGAMTVPELDGCLNGFRGEWEWMEAFETMGAISIDYKEEFLREEVSEISLGFSYTNNVRTSTSVILSESDKVTMYLGVDYDYEKSR